jgi:hypothetical protein
METGSRKDGPALVRFCICVSSDTRHQTIVPHRALLKHPSWRRRGAQWNIISYGRSRSSGKHVILSATVAVMVGGDGEYVVRPAHFVQVRAQTLHWQYRSRRWGRMTRMWSQGLPETSKYTPLLC